MTGNTEIGIETKFKNMEYKDLIYISDIAKLQFVKVEENFVEIGSGVTLNRLESQLKQIISQFPVQKL